jgi:ssDNA-binding Zn-finger/Zn-ribbon topoisomerase 1
MPEITLSKDGVLSAVTYVQCTRAYECACGTELTITLTLPEGVTFKSAINVTNVKCPSCHEPIVIPKGHHYIENYQLLTREETP